VHCALPCFDFEFPIPKPRVNPRWNRVPWPSRWDLVPRCMRCLHVPKAMAEEESLERLNRSSLLQEIRANRKGYSRRTLTRNETVVGRMVLAEEEREERLTRWPILTKRGIAWNEHPGRTSARNETAIINMVLAEEEREVNPILKKKKHI